MTLQLPEIPRLDNAGCAALRDRLRAVGYNPSALVVSEQLVRNLVFNAAREPIVRWRLSLRDDPTAKLLRLFMYYDTLTEVEARDALETTAYTACVEAGVLAVSDAGVRACFQLTPFYDLWIFGDIEWTHENAAMGATVTTFHLAAWLPVAGQVHSRFCAHNVVPDLLARISILVRSNWHV
jgi:hypothetical protein